jgi:aspartyl-tRNA(Asn)/glutamyl-tRNA(Gln) amidotransferase subunit B
VSNSPPRWEPVIGLEVHVQLATASKVFSGSATEFGAPPNSLTDPVVLGLPGALPVFNRRALELALVLGMACGSHVRLRSRFARKHYFYPDLPKGYQISQYDEPLCEGGSIEITIDGQARAVQLKRIHLEEDAGKNIHVAGGAVSLVDLNRAGVPLIEVVSEPDLFSAAEAGAYMRELRLLCRWLDISGGDMEKGQLRCDANVSLRPRGTSELGTRAELKNINSFRFVEAAIDNEIARQAAILDGGGQVVQETRLWDADAGRSQSMRSKEEAMDYRYFPDPDLPPLEIDSGLLDQVRAALPPLPAEVRARLGRLEGLTEEDILLLAGDRERASFFLAAAGDGRPGARHAKAIANWMLGEPELHSRVPAARLIELAELVAGGTIGANASRKVVAEMMTGDEEPRAIVERLGLAQLSDEGAILKMAEEIVAAHPAQAASYRAGKQNLIGFFVGQLMKRSGGVANPRLASEILRRLLDEGS